MAVIDKIAPYKSKREKGNIQKWFDVEVLEKLYLRNKLHKNREINREINFSKFKKLRLHIDKEFFLKRSSQKRLVKPKNYWNPLNLWVCQTKQ